MSIRRGRLRALCVWAAGWMLFAPLALRAQVFSEPGYSAETVVTLPQFQVIGFAFAPDGALFVWQKNGLVRVVRNGVVNATPFLDLTGQVNVYDDRGLLGFAFDPAFSTNGFVYLAYVSSGGVDPNDNGPKTARIVRVTANPANRDVALAGSSVVILDGLPQDSGSHNVNQLAFARDGTLFVGNGDGGSPSIPDAAVLGCLSIDSYRGKLLRINPDGSAPRPPQVVNPFYDGTSSIRSKVWAIGLRNPYRFALHPQLDAVIVGDVGWNTWEEVNWVVAGGNYGWPCYEGAGAQPDYQSFAPGTCAANPPASVRAPAYTYDHSVGRASIGGVVYQGGAYPSVNRGAFFMADYSAEWMRRLRFDDTGHVVANDPFATNAGAIVSMAEGPDGLLYYADIVTGQIRRIRFAGVSAVGTATPNAGPSPLAVSFSSAGSSDGLGGALSFLWTFGDGTTSTLANPQHTYTASGVVRFDATLRVTNGAGQSSTVTVPVTVGNAPPVPQIGAPSGGVGVEPGTVIAFAGSATDPEQGPLPASALSWSVLLHHDTHVHPSGTFTGASGSFVAAYHGVGTYAYELTLTATDAVGLQATTSVTVPVLADTTPPTVPASVAASPVNSAVVDVTWAASTDNAVVALYRIERCTGVGCSGFAEVGTSATLAYQDLGLAPSTTYRYRVRAEDADGNRSAYSSAADATTPAAPPPPGGLVAAWGLNEGTGLTAADASGRGNPGTLTNGPSWVAGKYGQGLQFDGTDDVVVVPDANALDLSTALTIEAWVRPATALAGWKAIVQKEADAYHLMASTGADRPAVGGTFDGVCCTMLNAPAPLPANQWSHLAGTYDGATLRLYVDGVEVAAQPRTGSLQATALPLRIGGNSYSGEHFIGTIDEVRLYDRALSPLEIAQDMATPVGDRDGDGVRDDLDNCPLVANSTQSDIGGVGPTSLPDGIGDACQCGDINDDGRATGVDGVLIQRASLGLAPYPGGVTTLPAPQKCDVDGGSTGDATYHCSGVDGTILKRASLGLPPSVQQTCVAADGS